MHTAAGALPFFPVCAVQQQSKKAHKEDNVYVILESVAHVGTSSQCFV